MLTSCGESSSPTTHTVVIDSTSYSPSVLVVRVGDVIQWSNRDILVHTVTSASGSFDSKDIPAGSVWSYTVPEKGDVPYRCLYHPIMQGTLRVR
ncbi:MAG: cupredoxin domain-containing protein [Thermoanaerobaculia bacterium]|nr:cupredoxin domain-containing protein [Thermoanaerobaculia bacterium]